MQKPILKNKKVSVGVFILEIKSAYLFHINGYLCTHIKVEQETEQYKELSLILENGQEVALEWTRRDRRGKVHSCTCNWTKGIHPLLKGETISPFRIPSTIAESCTVQTFISQKAPEGFFFWKALDCGMEKDPTRRELARKISPTHAYEIYISKVVDLEGLTYEEWEKRNDELVLKAHRKNCSKPQGTDGWR